MEMPVFEFWIYFMAELPANTHPGRLRVDTPGGWIPVNHGEDMGGAPGSLLQTDSGVALTGIGRVN